MFATPTFGRRRGGASGERERRERGRRETQRLHAVLVRELLHVGGRTLVLVEGADVVPVGIARACGDALARLQQPVDKLRELARAVGEISERPLVVDVDAHADLVVQRGLLDVVADQAALGLDHAEIDVHVVVVHGDGQRGVLLAVDREQLAVVERRQHVAVHDDERALEVRHHRQGTRGAERLGLPVEVQLHLGWQIGVRQVDGDQLPEVAHAQVDLVDAAARQRADDVLEHRPVADRHERLRDDGGVGAQPHPQPARQDDCSHATPPRRAAVVLSDRTTDKARERDTSAGGEG